VVSDGLFEAGSADPNTMERRAAVRGYDESSDPVTITCSSCGGPADWADEAWVCEDCGDEWYPDHFDRRPRARPGPPRKLR
jgi:hypothetical protein